MIFKDETEEFRFKMKIAEIVHTKPYEEYKRCMIEYIFDQAGNVDKEVIAAMKEILFLPERYKKDIMENK